MTIIAWDGKSAAVDKLCNSNGWATTVDKFSRVSKTEVAFWCGDNEQGLVLAKWYKDGKNIKDWPHFQKTDDWSRLIVVSVKGVIEYEKEPMPQVLKDKFMAWGSGRDYALGAMARGATAKEAVEVANKLCISCGHGVDAIHFGRNK